MRQIRNIITVCFVCAAMLLLPFSCLPAEAAGTDAELNGSSDPEVRPDAEDCIPQDAQGYSAAEPVPAVPAADEGSVSLAQEEPAVPEEPDVMEQVTFPARVIVYRTGYAYKGPNALDGNASASFGSVPEGVVFSAGNAGTTFAVNQTSNSAVLPKNRIVLTENAVAFYPVTKGSSKVDFTLNGKQFTTIVSCYQPRLSVSSLLMYKKQKKAVSVKGVPAGTKVTYSSSNKAIASVTKAGVVKAKKSGNAVIYAQVGSVKIGTVASVTSKKKVRAVKRARRMAKSSTYSQPKRMLKGYYDCSSLVYRAYKPEGIHFGSPGYWAPTAAGEAAYLNSKHKIVC